MFSVRPHLLCTCSIDLLHALPYCLRVCCGSASLDTKQVGRILFMIIPLSVFTLKGF